jgi:hypothetical protein
VNQLALRDDVIEPDVPGSRLDAVEFLARVRDADQARMSPRACGIAALVQEPVVEASAHAEAMAGAIEPKQRQQDDIETRGVAHPVTRSRLEQPIALRSMRVDGSSATNAIVRRRRLRIRGA